MKQPQKLKDSGERRETGTGAVRDLASKKGRFDLVAPFAIRAMAQQMARGAAKYDARNWEKGMPLSWFIDSCSRHLEQLKAGFDDEPHADAVIWNIAGFIETRERIRRGILPKALDDMPHTYKGLNPEG